MSDWEPILKELERRRAAARAMGGPERVEREQQVGPWGLAAGLGYDDIIDPRELRNALLAGLSLLEERRSVAEAEP